jgi:glycosyltransferase involved in cell wall biosynthesis
VEAQACGTPVIAFGRGGALETIRGSSASKPTGLFFDRQQPDAIAEAVREFERHAERILPLDCWHNAQQFSAQRFRESYTSFVRHCWDAFRAAPPMVTGIERQMALQEATRGLGGVTA